MTKICWFSGTGNTLWSAKKIAEALGDCELVSIGAEAGRDRVVIEAEAVVLLFPAYAYGPPPAVRRFIEKTEFRTGYVAALVTFGTSPGGALASAGRLLRRKKIPALYYGRIPAVENYIAIFGPPGAEKAAGRLAMQRAATEEAARAILGRRQNRVNSFRPLSALISLLFSCVTAVFCRCYRLSAACNGCGICVKVCSVGAVALKEGRPVFFPEKCEHCQACIAWCPRRALHFARIGAETPRWRHPEITAADLGASPLRGDRQPTAWGQTAHCVGADSPLRGGRQNVNSKGSGGAPASP